MRHSNPLWILCLASLAPWLAPWAAHAGPPAARATDTTVCVDVQIRSHGATTPPEPSPKAKPPSPVPHRHPSKTARRRANPYPVKPYLKRLLEHYITHEPGFRAHRSGCQERLVVELYPLRGAWTVFGRYSGRGMEEKVDKVSFSELPRLARRLVLALLHGRHIEDTIDRLSVLNADSSSDLPTIKGTNHFTLSLGSTQRFPVPGINTAPDSGQGPATRAFRVLPAVSIQLGYRGSFRRWALDAYARFGIGTSDRSGLNNVEGGHINHEADLGAGVAFSWYLTPDAVNTLYAGVAAAFEASIYSVVEPQTRPAGAYDGDLLVGAGMTFSGILGYEFLRTSRVRPFIQLEVGLPAWVVDTQNDFGGFQGWTPSTTLLVGMLF